jgi:type I restriction enzyme S subunit
VNGPWQIPDTWAWVEAGEIAEIVGGGTPRTQDLSNFEDGDIPWITPADLSGYKDKYISRGARNITRKGLDNSGARLMPEGTVLFSSRAPIGYVAIASNPVATNQGFKSFVLHPHIKSDYVYYYLQRAKDLVVELSSGTTFREISGAKAALIPFPVAPIGEQERIVAEIEKQFTRLDAALTALKRAKVCLKGYRIAIRNAACEGRLVPTEAELARHEGRSYETASARVEQILAERRSRWVAGQLGRSKPAASLINDDKWKKKYRTPAGPKTKALDTLPEGWTWATVDQLTGLEPHSITDGPFGSNLKTEHYTTTGPRVIRLQNIGDGVFVDAKAHISEKHFESLIKHEVLPGDIVIAALGERPPRACIIPDYVGPAIVKADCVRFKPASAVASARYLVLALNAESTRKRMAEIVHGVGRPRLNLEEIKSIALPLPPIEEQLRVAAQAEDRLSIVDKVEQQIGASLLRAERLRQRILQIAFDGKSVPQDPNEEPAGRLLDKIRAVGRQQKHVSIPIESHVALSLEEKMTSKDQTSKKNLVDTLRASSKPLSPEDLFSKAGYDRESIDDFYAALKQEIRAGRVRETRPDNKTVKIQAVSR